MGQQGTVMPLSVDKPRAQLEKWIRLLGWRCRLRMYQHVVENDAPPTLRGKVITWYEAGKANCGRTDCFLQINEHPLGQVISYNACVYAVRYRICTGWHEFRLYSTDEGLRREAERLRKWLDWKWFSSLDGRRTFRKSHPECVGYGWKRIADEGPSVARARRTPPDDG